MNEHKKLKRKILNILKKVLGNTHTRDKLVCDIVEYIEKYYERKPNISRPD